MAGLARLFRVPLLPVVAVIAGCAHAGAHPAKVDCYVESGWLDSTNGCSARAGYPDCYRVCADGSRVRVQDAAQSDRLSVKSGGAPARSESPPN